MRATMPMDGRAPDLRAVVYGCTDGAGMCRYIISYAAFDDGVVAARCVRAVEYMARHACACSASAARAHCIHQHRACYSWRHVD